MVRTVSVLVPPFRRRRLENLVGTAVSRGGVAGGESERHRRIDNATYSARLLADKLSVSDWFIVSQIGHHMDPLYFPGFVTVLAEEISRGGGAGRGRQEKIPPLAFRTPN
jgi:hypothetical protein